MVLPQYTFAALAFGALAAIAVTLYATLGTRPNRQNAYAIGSGSCGSSGSARATRQ
jgi:hypothetical protein